MTQAQANEFCLSNDTIPLTKTQFYICQRKLIPIVEKLARQNSKNARLEMAGLYYISYDGSWSARRNATNCILEFIYPEGKIVDFDYLSRAQLNEKNSHLYSVPSNEVEDILVEKMSNM